MAGDQTGDSSMIVEAIVAAHKNGDSAKVRALAHTLNLYIRRTGERLAANDWPLLFKTLKAGRVFDYLQTLAELLIQVGHEENGVRCYYAQGLIECGKMTAAISVLARPYDSAMAKMKDNAIVDDDELEAVGLVGRAFKQCYIEFARQAHSAGTPLPEAARDCLQQAIRTYGAVVSSGSQSPDGWHEINYIALAKHAERIGVIPPLSSGADQLAGSLIRKLGATALKEAESGDPWPSATVGEAYLAFEQWQNAAQFYGIFASHKSVHAFHLGSAIRQLEEIWQLDKMSGEPKQILQALKARLLSIPGGELQLPSGTIQSLGDNLGFALQAMFGKSSPIKLEWFKTALKRARSVARILVNDKPLGTGFLVSGKEMSPYLQNKAYLLTNAHVLSEPPAHYLARPPYAAKVVFEEGEQSQAQRGYGCRLVWQSGVGQLDACLLELTPAPPDIEPFPLSQQDLHCSPGAFERGQAERVNVIGHPGTEKLSISVQDNEIMDVGPRDAEADAQSYIYYHYKTPTKPGNSGSPVCYGDEWKVCALHHAGPEQTINQDGMLESTMAKLGGREGHYEANEGVSIVSIKKQIHADLTRQHAANPNLAPSQDPSQPPSQLQGPGPNTEPLQVVSNRDDPKALAAE